MNLTTAAECRRVVLYGNEKLNLSKPPVFNLIDHIRIKQFIDCPPRKWSTNLKEWIREVDEKKLKFLTTEELLIRSM